jgi:hypothetical protein
MDQTERGQVNSAGKAVPSLVLTDYLYPTSTHHRHPHIPGETLCARPIGDTSLLSHDNGEVTCDDCIVLARRGYDMFGEAVSFKSDGSPAVTKSRYWART